MSKHKFTASKEGSAAYFEALNEYMEANVLDPDIGFRCDNAEKFCKKSCEYAGLKFIPGQLHHIGKYYDLKRDEKPFRIVVSGAEYGDGSENVSLKNRSDEINQFIERYISSDLSARHFFNQHMWGTLILLQLLFGKEPKNPSKEGGGMSIDIKGNLVHVFQAFSLTNFLLCSARSDSGKQQIQHDAYTSIMREMCKEHYKNALEILKPQIIILQGTRSYDFWHDKPYSKELNWDPAKESQSDSYDFWREHRGKDLNFKPLKIEKVKLANCEKETLILPLCHPSQLPFWSPRNWGSAGRWAIRGYIKPAVENLLKEYEKIYG
ncbi:MAG: hypothetical protein OXU71_02065 [Gammaproteobacteria bacterium]|nr:hypothetical protein [Gammaproteobacteria bacterium]